MLRSIGKQSGESVDHQVQDKGETNLDFTEARDSEWQWHQLGHMQVCISLQTDNLARTPPLSFFTGRMPFLPPNQQRQSTEGNKAIEQLADADIHIMVAKQLNLGLDDQ